MKNLKIEIESEIGTDDEKKFVDIAVFLYNEKTEKTEIIIVEVEIENTLQNIKQSIEKIIKHCDLLVIGVQERGKLQEIEEMLQSFPHDVREKIFVCLLAQLLHCSKKLSEVVKLKFLEERGL